MSKIFTNTKEKIIKFQRLLLDMPTDPQYPDISK